MPKPHFIVCIENLTFPAVWRMFGNYSYRKYNRTVESKTLNRADRQLDVISRSVQVSSEAFNLNTERWRGAHSMSLYDLMEQYEVRL